jgi:hypothetical protein
MRTSLLILALVIPACVDASKVDQVFCDDSEVCAEPPHTGVICGGVECQYDPCYVGWTCNPDNPLECIPNDYSVGHEDNNVCTSDECVLGRWVHIPINVDDGDACTVDTCDPVDGVMHKNVCG